MRNDGKHNALRSGRRTALLLLVGTALVVGCGGRTKRPSGFDAAPIRSSNAAAQASFDAALARLEADEFDKAREQFRLHQASFPNDPTAELAELYAGRAGLGPVDLLAGVVGAVDRTALSELAQVGSAGRVDPRVRWAGACYYATGLMKTGSSSEALIALSNYPSLQISPVVLTKDRAACRAMVAESLFAAGRFREAVGGYSMLWAESEHWREFAKSRAFEAAEGATDSELVELSEADDAFVRAVGGWTFLRRRAESASGAEVEALAALHDRIATDLESIGAADRTGEVSAPLLARAPQHKRVVGVAVPLSGSASRAGRRTVEAALFANSAFEDEKAQTTLVFVDTVGRSAEAVLEELRDAGASVAVGLMSSKTETVAFESAARAVEMPLLVLSAHRLHGAGQTWAFRTFMDAESEARAVAEVAAGEQYDQRVAVLYPDIGYGKQMAGWFGQEFEALGGSVVYERAYDPNEKDFSHTAAKVAAARPDAVFIADVPGRVGIVSAFLAQANVWGIPGSQRPDPRSRRIQVHYLGTSLWNDGSLLAQSGSYVAGALIPAWTSGAFADEHSAALHSGFGVKIGRPADASDAFVFDSIRLARAVLDARKFAPDAVRSALLQRTLRTGATGSYSFTEGGEAKRALRFVTVEDGGFVRREVTAAVGVPESS